MAKPTQHAAVLAALERIDDSLTVLSIQLDRLERDVAVLMARHPPAMPMAETVQVVEAPGWSQTPLPPQWVPEATPPRRDVQPVCRLVTHPTSTSGGDAAGA